MLELSDYNYKPVDGQQEPNATPQQGPWQSTAQELRARLRLPTQGPQPALLFEQVIEPGEGNHTVFQAFAKLAEPHTLEIPSRYETETLQRDFRDMAYILFGEEILARHPVGSELDFTIIPALDAHGNEFNINGQPLPVGVKPGTAAALESVRPDAPQQASGTDPDPLALA